jgi:Cytochrome P460
MRRVIALGLLATLGTACGSSESQPGAAEPPATEATTTVATSTEATSTGTVAPPLAEPPRKKPKAPPGIPRFVAGYTGWVRVNDRPIPPRTSDPHNGTKNVFISTRPGANGLFRNGAVVVKEAARPGTDFIGLIAIMRKRAGADPAHNDWVFVEYTRDAPGTRFAEAASGSVCWSCHVAAEATDYVFTLGE